MAKAAKFPAIVAQHPFLYPWDEEALSIPPSKELLWLTSKVIKCVSISKLGAVKLGARSPDWYLCLLQSALRIDLPRTQKHKRQFSLLLCFRYCYFVANHLLTVFWIIKHVASLIDPGFSTDKRHQGGTDCSVSTQQREKWSQICDSRTWDRVHQLKCLTMRDKKRKLIVTWRCAY